MKILSGGSTENKVKITRPQAERTLANINYKRLRNWENKLLVTVRFKFFY